MKEILTMTENYLTPISHDEEKYTQFASINMPTFRKRKAEILDHADIYMELGLPRFGAFQIVDTTDRFQDDESQEFLKSLSTVTGQWMESIDKYTEAYTPSILADLEIYYVINQGVPLKVVSDYLKVKASYSESKQFLAQLFLLNGISNYTLSESLAIIAKTTPSPEIIAAITVVPDDYKPEIDSLISTLSTILPDYITEMLYRVVKTGSNPEFYARMLELDF